MEYKKLYISIYFKHTWFKYFFCTVVKCAIIPGEKCVILSHFKICSFCLYNHIIFPVKDSLVMLNLFREYCLLYFETYLNKIGYEVIKWHDFYRRDIIVIENRHFYYQFTIGCILKINNVSNHPNICSFKPLKYIQIRRE